MQRGKKSITGFLCIIGNGKNRIDRINAIRDHILYVRYYSADPL